MSRKKLKIGIVGLGRAGWYFHCQPLFAHPDFKLVAVADPVEERRIEAEKEFKCSSFSSIEQMLDSAELDAVVIASPTHLHKDMAQLAFRRGLHVVLEKPMAIDAKQAQAIIRSASKYNKVLSVFFPHRYYAYFRHLQKIIASGKIGDVYQVRLGWFNYVRRADWQSLSEYGGGILINLGSHFIDLLFQLIGCDIKRVFCHTGRVAALGDAEDVTKLIMESSRGVIGEADLNFASAIFPYELEVYGAKGALYLEKQEFHLRYFDPGKLPAGKLDKNLAAAGREYPDDKIVFIKETIPVDDNLQIDFYRDFAKAIRTGSSPIVKPKEALAVMRMVERLRESAGRIVDFTKSEM
jgi:predicted dehydrogenase